MQTPRWCLEHAERIGPMCRELVDQLFASWVLDNLRAAQCVLGLKKKYSPKRLEAVCWRAVKHGTASYRAVKSILKKGLDMEPADLRLSLLPNAYKGRSRFCRDTRNILQ